MKNIKFTGHNIEVTPALRAVTEEKMEKLGRHFDHITSVHVVFDVEKLNQIVEASLSLARFKVHARAESENMYTAIDDLVHKLDSQLAKHKGKILDHSHHRGDE